MEPSYGKENVKSYASKNLSDYGRNIPCQCLHQLDTPTSMRSSRKFELSEHVLGIVSNTDSYLKERRIPELICFLLTKILADAPDRPLAHLVKILDDCMLYRAGFGRLPVLYEKRHLKAVVKSFDPCQRGWVNAGQLRRAYITLGLNPPKIPDAAKIPTDELLKNLKNDQEIELSELIMAGASEGGSRKTNTPVSSF